MVRAHLRRRRSGHAGGCRDLLGTHRAPTPAQDDRRRNAGGAPLVGEQAPGQWHAAGEHDTRLHEGCGVHGPHERGRGLRRRLVRDLDIGGPDRPRRAVDGAARPALPSLPQAGVAALAPLASLAPSPPESAPLAPSPSETTAQRRGRFVPGCISMAWPDTQANTSPGRGRSPPSRANMPTLSTARGGGSKQGGDGPSPPLPSALEKNDVRRYPWWNESSSGGGGTGIPTGLSLACPPPPSSSFLVPSPSPPPPPSPPPLRDTPIHAQSGPVAAPGPWLVVVGALVSRCRRVVLMSCTRSKCRSNLWWWW